MSKGAVLVGQGTVSRGRGRDYGEYEEREERFRLKALSYGSDQGEGHVLNRLAC